MKSILSPSPPVIWSLDQVFSVLFVMFFLTIEWYTNGVKTCLGDIFCLNNLFCVSNSGKCGRVVLPSPQFQFQIGSSYLRQVILPSNIMNIVRYVCIIAYIIGRRSGQSLIRLELQWFLFCCLLLGILSLLPEKC